MDAEHPLAASRRLPSLIEKFRNKKYRNSYVASHTRRFLARQMRKLRANRSQEEFGEIIDKQQTVVSRLEDPKYGKWTLQTLFDVAEKLDLAVIVRFVDHATFLRFTESMDEDATVPTAYSQETMDEMLATPASHSLLDRIVREQSFEFKPPSRPTPSPNNQALPAQPKGLLQ